ncbi:hypothetical protein H4219_004475 [Mycoemilia scoparia]|uniref:C3H1-type domain-containing protein n=1 Tax=Mycoemilia scoparia TaxID=417184 RepID=A0A9W8DLF6_9FUNG|nr:hypothetical protein H4219_004475 [Mycoemilia scoparia]
MASSKDTLTARDILNSRSSQWPTSPLSPWDEDLSLHSLAESPVPPESTMSSPVDLAKAESSTNLTIDTSSLNHDFGESNFSSPKSPTVSFPTLPRDSVSVASVQRTVLPKGCGSKSRSASLPDCASQQQALVTKAANNRAMSFFVAKSNNSDSGHDSDDSQRLEALYKTELCSAWIRSGQCKYGEQCRFAHGKNQLRPRTRHPRYRTELCRTYSAKGACPYGDRCDFLHVFNQEGRIKSAHDLRSVSTTKQSDAIAESAKKKLARKVTSHPTTTVMANNSTSAEVLDSRTEFADTSISHYNEIPMRHRNLAARKTTPKNESSYPSGVASKLGYLHSPCSDNGIVDSLGSLSISQSLRQSLPQSMQNLYAETPVPWNTSIYLDLHLHKGTQNNVGTLDLVSQLGKNQNKSVLSSTPTAGYFNQSKTNSPYLYHSDTNRQPGLIDESSNIWHPKEFQDKTPSELSSLNEKECSLQRTLGFGYNKGPRNGEVNITSPTPSTKTTADFPNSGAVKGNDYFGSIWSNNIEGRGYSTVSMLSVTSTPISAYHPPASSLQ